MFMSEWQLYVATTATTVTIIAHTLGKFVPMQAISQFFWNWPIVNNFNSTEIPEPQQITDKTTKKMFPEMAPIHFTITSKRLWLSNTTSDIPIHQ